MMQLSPAAIVRGLTWSKTRVLTVDPKEPNPASVEQAAAAIRAGSLVAFPTETVYGLGADATSRVAVGRIFEAKRRPSSDPLIVHIAELEQALRVTRAWPPAAEALAKEFWPGPLTLVLPRAAGIPARVSAGRTTVAVRMPRHPVALALIRAAGRPIAAPSANLFSRPSPTTAAHVLEDLDGRIEMVVDGGPTDVGVESTVADLTSDPPAVLRPGGVSLERLREVLPALDLRLRRLAPDSAEAAAPGMLLKHYSPRAEVLLFDGPDARERMAAEARRLLEKHRRIGALAFDEDVLPSGLSIVRLGPSTSPEDAAQRLFSGLRTLDAEGVDAILVRPSARVGLGLAVWDRLLRAAEGKVIAAPL